ncbi:MAG TPA: hypothetical protein VJU53_13330 [Burkholderiaceae bacterium]|nr:hypothetical protein [Burkholderiaceae bacterium]
MKTGIQRPDFAVRMNMRGQSTTEFIVLALVLTPLLLAVPLLGKYLDLSQHAAQASRYAAFEISVRGPAAVKDEATVAAEARRRLFSTSDAPIKTNDVAGDFVGMRNPLWTDFRGDHFLPRFADGITHEAAQETRAVPPPLLAAFAGDNGFKLPMDNLFTARIDVFPERPRDFRFWSDDNPGVNLRMNRQTGILIDAWNAASADMVRDKIENAGPSAPPVAMPKFDANIMQGLIDNAAALGPYPILPLKLEGQALGIIPALLGEPSPRFGSHDPNIVPCDRLDPPC